MRARVAWWIAACCFAAFELGAQPFQDGEIFVGLPRGEVGRFEPSGRKLGMLRASRGQMTGMCFDAQNRLYTTDFVEKVVARYSPEGDLLDPRWASGFEGSPESCVVDAVGNVYVGTVEPSNAVYQFAPTGQKVRTFRPRSVGQRGMDWIDLAADQCTLFYTSEGPGIGRYDLCRETQLPDFAALSGECFALRIRDNGEVMVACGPVVYRLSPTGTVKQRYEIPGEKLFGLNLDRDGRSFWTGGINSANVYQIDIETGSGTHARRFNAAGAAPRRNERRRPGKLLETLGQVFQDVLEELAPGERMGGLAVYGERMVAIAEARKDPSQRQSTERPAPPPPPLPPPSVAVPVDIVPEPKEVQVETPPPPVMPQSVPSTDMSAEERPASRRIELEPPPMEVPPLPVVPPPSPPVMPTPPPSVPPSVPPSAPPLPQGILSLGEVTPVAFNPGQRGMTLESVLQLGGMRLRGAGEIRLSTDLNLDRVHLEVQRRGDWITLGAEPIVLRVDEGQAGPWPLRLRIDDCPETLSPSEKVSIHVSAQGADGDPLRLSIPLQLEIRPDPWLHCWWPLLAMASSLGLGGLLLHGFLSPSRFPPRAALVLSPEEDISEGFSYSLRAQRGSGRSFYRDARLYLFDDFRFGRRAAGAWLRLRAEGARLRMKSLGGVIMRQAADGEWETVGEEETMVRPGVLYRNELATIFFELRQS